VPTSHKFAVSSNSDRTTSQFWATYRLCACSDRLYHLLHKQNQVSQRFLPYRCFQATQFPDSSSQPVSASQNIYCLSLEVPPSKRCKQMVQVSEIARVCDPTLLCMQLWKFDPLGWPVRVAHRFVLCPSTCYAFSRNQTTQERLYWYLYVHTVQFIVHYFKCVIPVVCRINQTKRCTRISSDTTMY